MGDDDEGFFRECRKHTPPKDFLSSLFDDYCRYVYVNNNSDDCKTLLSRFLQGSKRWKRFYRMGEGTAFYSIITRYRKTGDYHLLGFDDGYPQWFYNQLSGLVQFAWGPLMEHRYCHYLKSGKYQTFNSSKSIVTKIVADYCGVGYLIPRTYYAKLLFDGTERIGVVVERAKGDDPVGFNHKLHMSDVGASLQKNLLSLWILDILCYQKDHRPGNYFIEKKKDDKYSAVEAFDNDCPTTLMPIPSISFVTYIGILPMFDKEGNSRIPYLSKTLFEVIEKFDEKKLNKYISNYCSSFEAYFLRIRVNKLKKYLSCNLVSGRIKLLADEEWSSYTMRLELNLPTLTYFSYFINNYVE